MLFGKLFGGRKEAKSDAAPTPAPSPARAVPPAPPKPDRRSATGGEQESKGFDPYNSGVFKKANAWERINRR